MEPGMTGNETELTALVISPNRDLAEQFFLTLPETRAFQILADLKAYPPRQTLDIRLRQLKPDVVMVDVTTDLEAAGELIRFVASFRPAIQVVGLHATNDSNAILRVLRLGASEFLWAPFEAPVQKEAVARIHRLRQPEAISRPEVGKVIVFTAAKPGSGSSTLATHLAFALRKRTGKRILLVDLDLTGGTVGFYLKLHHQASVIEALEHGDRIDTALWNTLTANCSGVDVLPAPESPYASPVDPNGLHDLLEYARILYDWVILDAPAVPHRVSLLAVSESDQSFLVTTSELASLHLTRKAVRVLEQVGFGRERFRVVINRSSKRDGIGEADIGKIFNCSVHATFPNDYFSLHRVISLGQPLTADCALGKAIERLAARLAEGTPVDKRKGEVTVEAKPALSQT
jgi:pilus assembly protein CpaE